MDVKSGKITFKNPVMMSSPVNWLQSPVCYSTPENISHITQKQHFSHASSYTSALPLSRGSSVDVFGGSVQPAAPGCVRSTPQVGCPRASHSLVKNQSVNGGDLYNDVFNCSNVCVVDTRKVAPSLRNLLDISDHSTSCGSLFRKKSTFKNLKSSKEENNDSKQSLDFNNNRSNKAGSPNCIKDQDNYHRYQQHRAAFEAVYMKSNQASVAAGRKKCAKCSSIAEEDPARFVHSQPVGFCTKRGFYVGPPTKTKKDKKKRKVSFQKVMKYICGVNTDD